MKALSHSVAPRLAVEGILADKNHRHSEFDDFWQAVLDVDHESISGNCCFPDIHVKGLKGELVFQQDCMELWVKHLPCESVIFSTTEWCKNTLLFDILWK